MIYEMPNAVVKLRSEEEYDEYNKIRKNASWFPCFLSWDEMRIEKSFYHKIIKLSNTLNYKEIRQNSLKVVSFPELKELLKRPPAKNPRKKQCKKCGCIPCHCKEIKIARKYGAKNCDACGQKLGLRGGYSGTDLCEPCCTGEAETLQEKFIEW